MLFKSYFGLFVINVGQPRKQNYMEMTQMQKLAQVPTLIIGNSQSVKGMRTLAKRLGKTNHTVLIQGETGTGKGVAAKEIHMNGRENSPFVLINCPAITSTLFESEMFGHKKGSFTDATEDRQGFFESAGSGTIFLDEIGTLPIASQVKLLHVLQDGMFSPVGDRRQIKMKARVIAGTNTDLEKAVIKGDFREDLFHRLNVIPFVVSPLRERLEDVPVLAEYFLSSAEGGIKKKLAPDALAEMILYHWPGNIRELQNVMIRSSFFADENEEIQLEHIQPYVATTDGNEVKNNTQKYKRNGVFLKLHELEEDYFSEVIKSTKGNQIEMSVIVGMHCSTISRKLKKTPKLKAAKKEVKEGWKKILIGTKGNVSQAAEIVGVSRSVFYNMLLSDPELKALIDSLRSSATCSVLTERQV